MNILRFGFLIFHVLGESGLFTLEDISLVQDVEVNAVSSATALPCTKNFAWAFLYVAYRTLHYIGE